ncbi:DUF2293 domain-containing protein [Hyalangium versicolor]|uniref:DUF2293 domain-containing protein n=1 Tax=Hyalangium versicolor TaxID=2861190 RepID=UPI001CCF6227|nr:DUF2293 domain-containing protein [Hyalangium versicolor]
MPDSLTVAPTSDPRRVRAPDGTLLTPPSGWALLPPGDAGLTRRVKAAGPTWTVVEKKGRKTFSRGVWAPEAHISAARAELEVERATPAYAKRRASDQARREREQAEYEVDFANAVLRFLAFAPTFTNHAKRLAVIVTSHAAPVGSGTVARTERIPVERRAEAAVIAWLRHQTTGYDDMRIARMKGARREVRRELAEISRALLDVHRRDTPHTAATCPLCSSLEKR